MRRLCAKQAQIWESSLEIEERPAPDCDDWTREDFIRNKYVRRSYFIFVAVCNSAELAELIAHASRPQQEVVFRASGEKATLGDDFGSCVYWTINRSNHDQLCKLHS